MAKLNIVLYEPEIPANTGNIGRTCVATGTRLHLIEPLGFRLNEKQIKRAGMDYWKDLDVTTYVNYQEFLEKNPGAKIYMATTKGQNVYTEVSYEEDCYIMFGKESAGIPEEILDAARIDGAGDWQIFWRIGMPLGMAGIVSAELLSFLDVWNMIEQPMTFLKTKSLWPLSLFLPQIGLEDAGVGFAAAFAMLVPALLLFFAGQEYLEQGITAAALKG